jgi:hypothetical protein
LISNDSQINELFINELTGVENRDRKAEDVLPVQAMANREGRVRIADSFFLRCSSASARHMVL